MAMVNAKLFYEELRKVEWKAYSKEGCQVVAEKIWSEHKDHSGAEQKDVAQVIHLAARVAHHADFETFKNFIENGEVPAFKLSKEEMKCLKGGKFWKTMAYIAGGAALVGAGVLIGRSIANRNNDEYQLGKYAKADTNLTNQINALTAKRNGIRDKAGNLLASKPGKPKPSGSGGGNQGGGGFEEME